MMDERSENVMTENHLIQTFQNQPVLFIGETSSDPVYFGKFVFRKLLNTDFGLLTKMWREILSPYACMLCHMMGIK